MYSFELEGAGSELVRLGVVLSADGRRFLGVLFDNDRPLPSSGQTFASLADAQQHVEANALCALASNRQDWTAPGRGPC